MRPVQIQDATRVLAEGQDEHVNLAIRDDVIDGINTMTSLWEPSPEDIQNIVDGGHVMLIVMGESHPPVWICAQPPSEL